jgi:hypothetical protein
MRLGCPDCGTQVDGRFAFGRLGSLSRTQIEFVETFLECRGKIKDVEQRLGISYPTVVGRLDEVVAAMERLLVTTVAGADATSAPFAAEPAPRPRGGSRSRDVLESLERGEITASEAASKLRTRQGASNE